MVERRFHKPQVAGSMPALERKTRPEPKGLNAGGTTRAIIAPQGWWKSVGFARWGCSPLLLARQTEDECREDQLQTGIATSIKRQPCWLTRLRPRPGRVETSGSCVRQGAANPIKVPVRELYSQVSTFLPSISVERYITAFQAEVQGAIP